MDKCHFVWFSVFYRFVYLDLKLYKSFYYAYITYLYLIMFMMSIWIIYSSCCIFYTIMSNPYFATKYLITCNCIARCTISINNLVDTYQIVMNILNIYYKINFMLINKWFSDVDSKIWLWIMIIALNMFWNVNYKSIKMFLYYRLQR